VHASKTSVQIAADVIEIERALARIAHLLTRARRHDRLVADAGVPVDRAAVPILRLLSESEPLRPGELAVQLAVEAPHVTRQVQRLEKVGYVERVGDPDDRRAYRIQLTQAGRDATDCIRQAGQRYLQEALAAWSPQDQRQLAELFHRMVDDFLAYGAGRDQTEASRTH
jgi:DNA-binding MarR family transcriptional regulator